MRHLVQWKIHIGMRKLCSTLRPQPTTNTCIRLREALNSAPRQGPAQSTARTEREIRRLGVFVALLNWDHFVDVAIASGVQGNGVRLLAHRGVEQLARREAREAALADRLRFL